MPEPQRHAAAPGGPSRNTHIGCPPPDGVAFGPWRSSVGILRKYSNFVGFPIALNGDKLNTIQPLWTLPKDAITEDQHKGTRNRTHELAHAALTGAAPRGMHMVVVPCPSLPDFYRFVSGGRMLSVARAACAVACDVAHSLW